MVHWKVTPLLKETRLVEGKSTKSGNNIIINGPQSRAFGRKSILDDLILKEDNLYLTIGHCIIISGSCVVA